MRRVARRGRAPGRQGDVVPTRAEAGGSARAGSRPKLAVRSSPGEEKMPGKGRGAVAVNNGRGNFPRAVPQRPGKPGAF